jgi:hypothetical protein
MPDTVTAKTSLEQAQREFTAHIRDPATVTGPPGVEKRRMKIYNDLVYNNIEGFISGGFPVTRSLYRDEDWHRLVRCFVRDGRCQTPYFLEISQEFIQFLMQQYVLSPVDPPFLLELVHYEWVELALDVAEEEIEEEDAGVSVDPLEGVPVLSPLVWNLSYQYPVHKIGPGFEPDVPPTEATYLVVYRNRDDEVGFLESNAATARLLELLRDNDSCLNGLALLEQLAAEMNATSVTSVVEFGANMLRQFMEQDIVTGIRASS